jgi:hypothetical protein
LDLDECVPTASNWQDSVLSYDGGSSDCVNRNSGLVTPSQLERRFFPELVWDAPLLLDGKDELHLRFPGLLPVEASFGVVMFGLISTSGFAAVARFPSVCLVSFNGSCLISDVYSGIDRGVEVVSERSA